MTLEITDIRCERVKDISVEDCIAEGLHTNLRGSEACDCLKDDFHALWDYQPRVCLERKSLGVRNYVSQIKNREETRMARATRETLALRHEFTNDERLIIGNELASAYNRKAEIEADEAVAKTQIKERKSQVELTIGTLSRNWINGFMIENVICELFWDQPNVGEVSYVRVDNGETVRARAMTEAERQMELSLETPKDVEVSVAASEEAVEEFFEHETGENLAAKYDKDEVDEEESEEGEDEELDEEDQSVPNTTQT